MEFVMSQSHLSDSGDWPLGLSRHEGPAVVYKAQSSVYIKDFAPFFPGTKQGAFCVLGCYMDDSADHGRKKVFSVGGFVGESDDWFDVERYWERALKREKIDYFRTSDCVNLEGEFRKLADRHG